MYIAACRALSLPVWTGPYIKQYRLYFNPSETGLNMVLNINQDEYLPELTDAAGVRVLIHPQDRMPFPQDEGIVAAPGLLTSIGIRQVMDLNNIIYSSIIWDVFIE